MALFTLAGRLPADWMAFIDNTAGEAALKKGYGKDAFVNDMLAAFLKTTARRGPRRTWLTPCPDLSRARDDGHGYTTTPTASPVLVMTAADAEYAAGKAVDDLQVALN